MITVSTKTRVIKTRDIMVHACLQPYNPFLPVSGTFTWIRCFRLKFIHFIYFPVPTTTTQAPTTTTTGPPKPCQSNNRTLFIPNNKATVEVEITPGVTMSLSKGKYDYKTVDYYKNTCVTHIAVYYHSKCTEYWQACRVSYIICVLKRVGRSPCLGQWCFKLIEWLNGQSIILFSEFHFSIAVSWFWAELQFWVTLLTAFHNDYHCS